jgi:hypothetical protein
MIKLADLKAIANTRLEDARTLLERGRFDGAAYLCGYAVEIALKFRAASTLNWSDFPETSAEFREYQSFKSHNLGTLLHLCGREKRIKDNFLIEWTEVNQWNPESRYKPQGVTPASAKSMIEGAARIVEQLL